MPKNAFFPWAFHSPSPFPCNFCNITVVAFLPPHSSRFNFHSYAQCEPTPQKLAQKWQLQPFAKDYGGHSLLQTSFAELPNILLPSFSGGFQAHKLLFTAILLKTKCWLCNKNRHVLLTYMPMCFSQTITPPPPHPHLLSASELSSGRAQRSDCWGATDGCWWLQGDQHRWLAQLPPDQYEGTIPRPLSACHLHQRNQHYTQKWVRQWWWV